MKKALTSVLLSLILTLTASGCAPELYERLLISAIGVDRTATGCRVTVLASETTEDGGQSTFSGEGDTVPEALSQIALESGRTPLYSHNAAILFGMQCAESGIAEQLDFFIRHYDSRPTAKVFLAEDTAESVLLQTDLTAERFIAGPYRSHAGRLKGGGGGVHHCDRPESRKRPGAYRGQFFRGILRL